MAERYYNTSGYFNQHPGVFELPTLIDVPYPSIFVGDLADTIGLITPDADSEELEQVESQLNEIIKTAAPSDMERTFYYVPVDMITKPLEEIATHEAQRVDKNVGIIHLDRFIGMDQHGDAFSRLNISRDPSNNLVARVGTLDSPEEQLATIANWARRTSVDELLLVDDVVASGGTFPPLLEKLHEELPTFTFRILAGIASSRGIKRIREKTGIDVGYLTKVIVSSTIPGGPGNLSLPVARDYTPFGGKTSRAEDGRQLSHPYFLPFSKPLSSVIAADKYIESADMLHGLSTYVCDAISKALDREVTIGDLAMGGLGIPASSLECLKGVMEVPDSRMPLRDYITYTRHILDRNMGTILEECAR